MAASKASKPRVKLVSRFAYAAGTAGILANLCLITMYVLLGLQGGSPEDGMWLMLVDRWLRRSDAAPYGLVRFGEFVGAGFLAGYLIVGFGLLLPWLSWPQLVIFGVGVLVGLPAYLGIPVWFLVLGRHLGASAG